MQSPPGAETVIDGKKYLYFVGTGYYCLQSHPEVIEAACNAAWELGIGSATSRTGYGNNPALLAVERRCAEFFGTEDALYYVSGYCGNAIMAQTLNEDFDVFAVDELAHYSVFDGVKQSGKRYIIFGHLDPEDLFRQLKKQLKPGERPLLMTDGIFPVTGAIPPVGEYIKVIGEFDGGGICLDDAHAVAVLGENGRGTYEYLGLEGENLYFSGTLSKAIGGHGGIIPGGKSLVDRAKERSHLYDGATPPPVPAAAATAKAMEIVRGHPEIRKQLWANVKKLKSGLSYLGIETDDTPVPIICIDRGDPVRMEALQRELMARGIVVAYVKSYAGAEGVIRIAVFSTHTDEMLERLLEELGRLL
jgi:7-keto-8-aminopelargonate synthetase-like enzyme